MTNADIDDFKGMLREFGYTASTVFAQSENPDDRIALPAGEYKIHVSDSAISGYGLFATADIQSDETIAPARLQNKRTIAGRFTNHAEKPNAAMVLLDNDNINLVSIKLIQGPRPANFGEEITIDYRQVLKIQGIEPINNEH